jgi:hypothetical protein
MEYYVVKVTETLARTWVVRAENEEEALAKVTERYNNSELNLDFDDYEEIDDNEKKTDPDSNI